MGPGPGPRRTCIGCRRTTHPDHLVRLVRTSDGGLLAGRDGPGRGAWICAGDRCWADATRRRAFARALRGAVRPEAIEAQRVAIGL